MTPEESEDRRNREEARDKKRGEMIVMASKFIETMIFTIMRGDSKSFRSYEPHCHRVPRKADLVVNMKNMFDFDSSAIPLDGYVRSMRGRGMIDLVRAIHDPEGDEHRFCDSGYVLTEAAFDEYPTDDDLIDSYFAIRESIEGDGGT